MNSSAAPGAMSRAAAARAVGLVLGQGRTLDAAFEAVGLASLQGADRSQAKALAFGALRWHHRHRALLGELLHRPLPARETLLEALLSVGLYQLLDDTQPDYAAVSATVGAARVLGLDRAAGLVNATLRRLQREREPLLARINAGAAARYSQPDWLLARLQADWPADWGDLCEATQAQPPLWLRANRQRTTRAGLLESLASAGIGATAGELDDALLLTQPVAVADIPGFDTGLLSVQDMASQLAASLLDAQPGMRVLDACAAPGGKAAHLAERVGAGLDLVALDIDPQRLWRVRQNLDRLGLSAILTAADASRPDIWWDGRPFDRILIDAPCSGTGVIRRHPDIKLLRRESDIAGFAARQLELLRALWPLVADDGQLLYATCSVLREENEGVVRQFLGEQPAAAALPAPCALPEATRTCGDLGWQILPGRGNTDGLYYVLMGRKAG